MVSDKRVQQSGIGTDGSTKRSTSEKQAEISDRVFGSRQPFALVSPQLNLKRHSIWAFKLFFPSHPLS